MLKKFIISLAISLISTALYAVDTIHLIILNKSGYLLPNFHQSEDGSQYITPVEALPEVLPMGMSTYVFHVNPAPVNSGDPMMSLVAGDFFPNDNGFEIGVRLGNSIEVACLSMGTTKIGYYSYSTDNEELTIRMHLVM